MVARNCHQLRTLNDLWHGHSVLPGLPCRSPNEFGLSANRCLICINIHHVVLSFQFFSLKMRVPQNLCVAEVSGSIVQSLVQSLETNSTLNAVSNSSPSFSHSKTQSNKKCVYLYRLYPIVITHSAFFYCKPSTNGPCFHMFPMFQLQNDIMPQLRKSATRWSEASEKLMSSKSKSSPMSSK